MSATLSSEIPAAIADKVQDIDWKIDFAFELLTCEHGENPNRLEKVSCAKCTFTEREQWLEAKLADTKPKKSIKDKNGNTLTLSSIEVKRGRFDDCIGIQENWS